MLKDKIDLEIKNVLKENIKIPERFSKKINMSLENINPIEITNKKEFKFKNYKYFKFIAAIFLFAIIAISMPLAAKTSEYIRNLFGISNQGIDTALNFDYFENISMDYISNDGLSVKVNSMLMDDLNLDILLEYKIDKKIGDIKRIDIKDLKIIDESNNVLYDENNTNYSNSISTYIVESIDDNISRQTIALTSNKFPNSKKLYITFSSVEIYTTFSKYAYTGEWNINIDVSQKFYERKIQQYICDTNDYFNIINADLTSTGLNFKISFNNNLNNSDLENIFRTFKLINESGEEIQRGNVLSLSKEEKWLSATYIGVTKYQPLEDIYVQFTTSNQDVSVKLKLDNN